MNEKDITFIVAISLLIILIIISIINKYRKDSNQHLKTFNEDFELYSYKVKTDSVEKKRPIKLNTPLNHIDDVNNISVLDVDLDKYSKSDLENTDTWLKMRTSFPKDFILNKINELTNNSYNNYFAIKDVEADKIIKERYLTNDPQTEIENINTIKRFIKNRNSSEYEVLYIGTFGFISNSVSTIFEIK